MGSVFDEINTLADLDAAYNEAMSEPEIVVNKAEKLFQDQTGHLDQEYDEAKHSITAE